MLMSLAALLVAGIGTRWGGPQGRPGSQHAGINSIGINRSFDDNRSNKAVASRGESSRPESSRGESSKPESSKPDSSKPDSSRIERSTIQLSEAARNEIISLEEFGALPPNIQTVEVGFQLENVYNLSLAQQTFMANGWLWLEWPASVQAVLVREGLAGSDLIDFANNINSFDLLMEPQRPTARLNKNGRYEQTFKFSGHFYTEDIDLHDYPFNALRLPMRLEVAPQEFRLEGPNPVILNVDAQQRGLLGSLMHIPGLELLGANLTTPIQRYRDDASFSSDSDDISFSQVLLSVYYRTHPFTSFAQWVLPLLLVMFTVFLAPSLSGQQRDLRIAIPSAALLTLVVMQQTYKVTIPATTYLTLLDVLYLWCFVATLALFVLFVWSANLCAAIDLADPDHKQQLAVVTARIKRVDRTFQASAMAGTLVILFLMLVVLNY